MAFDAPRKPFSKRDGYRFQTKAITVREDAPVGLRNFLLDTAVELGLDNRKLSELAYRLLGTRPGQTDGDDWQELNRLVRGLEWFRVYDYLEQVHDYLSRPEKMYTSREAAATKASSFEDQMNAYFEDHGIGWQVIKGEVVTRGIEVFESLTRGAVDALETAGRVTARDEIHEALIALSRRPEADLTGAIQHAMAALECVVRDVCGDERATLGEAIKRFPGTIPKPLDDSVAKAWGYASETARHVREGRRPERKEVELIVGLAATVATYLSR